jgi:type IV pilus assembly protein PilM
MFNFSKKPAFGLDLSDLSLKIIQLKRKGKELALASYAKKAMPAGLIQGGEIKKEKEVTAILKQALTEVKGEPLRTKRVICNLPEEKVFVRVIQLPRMKKEEIDQAIRWEAEAHIPLSIDEVYLDWQIIKPLKNHLDHFDVLIAAAPKTLINSYLIVLKNSGLQPIAFEPESVAVVRSLIKKDEGLRPILIVDLGATGTNFVIFSALAIRFTAHIAISGQLFAQAIMEKLGVSQTQAEQLKIKLGLDKIVKIKVKEGKSSEEHGKVYQALEPLLNDLVKQIQDYISFYHEHATHVHGPDGAITQVLLCGGDSLLNNLPSFLSSKLNLPVKLGNPWINIYSTPPKKILGVSYRKSLTYTTALGLALRNF